MSKKRLLFISNLYPNPRRPHMASFNRQQVAALRRHFDVEVVAPVSWRDRLRGGALPRANTWGEVIAHHPTYWYTPAWGRRFYGRFYLNSIRSLVLRLNRERAFDFVFGAWLYPDGWAAAKIAQELGVPLFLKVHGTDVNRLVGGTRLTSLSMQAVKQAQTVFCVSQALKDKLTGFGCNPDRLVVVYNGVNKEVFYPLGRDVARSRLGVVGNNKVVLYVGNLVKTKGLGELVVAIGKLKDRAGFDSTNLVVVGEGPFLSALEDMVVKENSVELVKFKGILSPVEVALWMNAADVLCLPSYNEGVPNVILEALACDTPVVATSVGGVPELVKGGGRIMLAPPGDCDALATCLEAVLRSPEWPSSKLVLRSWVENAAEVAAYILPCGRGGHAD